jgi:DNA replication protein DnaC
MINQDDKTISVELALSVAHTRGFPLRHLRVIENDLNRDEPFTTLLGDIKRGIESSGLVIVTGNAGTGKTMAGVWFGVWYSIHRMRAMYWTVSGLMSDQKTWFSAKGGRGEEPFAAAKSCGLLVIDQLKAEAGTMYDNNELSEIIDQRYQDLRPTIVLTNVAKPKLPEVIPYHIVDRTRDGGALIELQGKSLRGEA